MEAQRARMMSNIGIRAAAAMTLLLQIALANAHDFGGSSSGGGSDSPPPPGPPCNSCPCSGPGGGGDGGFPGNSSPPPSGSSDKPISFYDGAKQMSVTDLTVAGVFPIVIQRKYENQSTYDSPLGYGWAFMHDRRLYEYPDSSIVVRHGCGTRDRYVLTGGSYVTPVGSMLATLAEQPDGSFQLRYLNGVTDVFDSQGRLIASSDARGNRHEYTYDSRGKLPLVGASKESIAPTQPMTVAYNYRLTRIDVRGADGVLTGRYVTFAYDESTGRLTSVTADDGRSVTYEHDVAGVLTLGNLTRVEGLEGVIATYAYADPLDPHNLTSITAAQGRTPIVNTYDDQDRVIRQEEGTRRMDIAYNVPFTRTTVTRIIRDHNGLNPYTAATTYEFDASGRVVKLVDALGHETRYVYNAAKMLTRKEIWTNASGSLSLLQAMDWTYDANGNKLTESVVLDSGETVTKSWTYDQNWIASEQVVSSAAPTRVFRTEYTFYYGADGRPINIQSEKRRRDDGSFQTTSYTYNARNRLLTRTLPDGVQLINEYTGDYVTRTYYQVSGSAIPQLQQRFEYDAEGNRTKEWDARNNLTQYVYDDKGRVISVTNPLNEQTIYTYTQDKLTQIEVGRTSADGEGQPTRLAYDTRDRVTGIQRKNDVGAWVDYQSFQLDSEDRRLAVTDAMNRTTVLTYDLLGRVKTITDPAGKLTQLQYDAAGNRTKVIDALNREVLYEYDDLNRIIAMVELGVSPSPRTEYGYDAATNLVTVKDPEDHTTTYAYDALSRNTRITQPLGQFVEYVYDNRDRLDSLVNARGNKIDFGYESWGSLSSERHYATTSSPVPTRTINYGHDHDGNITSVTDDGIQPGAAYLLTYDALSRVYDETIGYIPGGNRVLRHRYDRYGNRNQLVLQDGSTITHTYTHNKLNQLTNATLAGATIGIDYYANDDRQTVTLPNGVTEAYVYRPNGPIQSITFASSGGQFEQFAYTYDDVLNVDTQTDQYGLHDFNYDGLNRLTHAWRPAPAGLPNESYTYDRVGNREDAGNAALYGYDNNNRITASAGLTYTFDADGSILARSDSASFTHDARNRLVQYVNGATTATYLHDPRGRRIRKSANGTDTWFLWDGTRLLAEFDVTGVRTERYGYLDDDYVPTQINDANGTYYVHSDYLQTPRLTTNASAQIVWRSRHEAFGKAIVESDPDGNGVAIELNVRFPGQHFDQETGLHYNYYRYYDSGLGRYLQQDPLLMADGANLYSYVRARPTFYVDPLGLESTEGARPRPPKPVWPPSKCPTGSGCEKVCSAKMLEGIKKCKDGCKGVAELAVCYELWRQWGVECAFACGGSSGALREVDCGNLF